MELVYSGLFDAIEHLTVLFSGGFVTENVKKTSVWIYKCTVESL